MNIVAGGRNATSNQPRVQVLEPFTAHQLRHTCATMLFEANVDIKTAQKFLGHANMQITLEIYTHLREEKEQSISSYNDLLSSKETVSEIKEEHATMLEEEAESNIILSPIKKENTPQKSNYQLQT